VNASRSISQLSHLFQFRSSAFISSFLRVSNSEPRYRGFLLATITLSISLGMFLCHVMGTFCSWKSVALVSATFFPCLVFIILSVVPESPSWLLTQHRVKDAEKAFRWLRGSSPDALCELEGLIKKHEMHKKEQDASNTQNDAVARLKINTQKPEFYRPLAIILLCFFVMQFSGVNSVAFYTISLMKNVAGPGNEYLSMIVIDVVRVIASFVACVLLKMCYRRTLLMVSGVGTSLCMTAVAVCMYLNKQSGGNNPTLSWLSMAFLIGYICFISCGLFPLPWVLQGEMLQQVTRGLSSGLTSCFNFICFFIVVKTFVQLSGELETFGVFMGYALIALAGTLVLYLILPETKNRTLQQIEDGFSKH
jgi:facilitated trehalose transporter